MAWAYRCRFGAPYSGNLMGGNKSYPFTTGLKEFEFLGPPSSSTLIKGRTRELVTEPGVQYQLSATLLGQEEHLRLKPSRRGGENRVGRKLEMAVSY
jgi:hypothetical protein